ncbi:hypothetical protein LEMLEM_LOCUS23602, partial [Lemmus lemmus]
MVCSRLRQSSNPYLGNGAAQSELCVPTSDKMIKKPHSHKHA